MPNMDDKLFFGPQHVNSNVICAIDIRVGGKDPLTSDLLEICLIPVNHSYKKHAHFIPFNLRAKPGFPVGREAKLNAQEVEEWQQLPFDSVDTGDLFIDWVERLDLPRHKQIIPLCWSWHPMIPWLTHWLGEYNFKYIFSSEYRDIQSVVNYINDKDDYCGRSIKYKIHKFRQAIKDAKVELFDKNSLMSNCMAVIDLYSVLLKHYY